MKLDYSLKVYNKQWRLVRVLPIPVKMQSSLKDIIRLPSQIALETFHSLSFPVLSQDQKEVEKVLGIKLDTVKDRYVLEVIRSYKVRSS